MAAVAIAAFVVGRISVSDEAPTPVVAVPTGISGTALTAAPSAVSAADVPADGVMADHITHQTSASQDQDESADPIVEAVYYRNCSAARAAGAAPIHAGETGYASHLDRDGDGVACE